MGDLNAKLNCPTCPVGKSLKMILEQTKFLILNSDSEPTFERIDQVNNRIINSKLDYVLVSSDVFNLNNSCSILNSELLKSDHKPIKCTVNLDLQTSSTEFMTP